jgi:hypothetical protein
MEDFEKGAERGDLNALRVGRIDLETRRVAVAPTPAAASKSTFIDSYVVERNDGFYELAVFVAPNIDTAGEFKQIHSGMF